MPQAELEIKIDTENAGDSGSTEIKLNLGAGTDYTVDWGDLQVDTLQGGDTTYDYGVGNEGIYNIKITQTGSNNQPLKFNNLGDKLKIIEIVDWGTSCIWSETGAAFLGCSNITAVGNGSVPDFSNSTVNGSVFKDCTSIVTLDVTGWSFATATYIGQMFMGMTSLTGFTGLKDLVITNVTNIQHVFEGCTSLLSADLSN